MSAETTASTDTPAPPARPLVPALTVVGLLAVLAALSVGAGAGILGWAGGALAQHWWRALALLGMYTLPGLALLRLLAPRDVRLAPAARLALAPAVSAALPPLLLLLAGTVGLRWSPAATWAYLLASLGANAWLWARGRRAGAAPPTRWQMPAWGPGAAEALLLAGLTLAALLARFYVARDLPTGLLGDAYHHTLMAQLLVDNGGLFRSWEPYAPLTTFTYHFGFHANVAFLHWLTGVDVVAGTVWSGQLINTLAVPAAFALAVVALRGSGWAGLWAAAVTGFALTIPAYYVAWGRYTQLTGQVVLVAAVACWAALADDVTKDQGPGARVGRLWSALPWRLIALTALMTASMVLTHYLVTVFAALFAASYVLAAVLRRASWRAAGRVALASAAAGLLAALLALPWLLNLASGFLVRNASGFSGGGDGAIEAARAASYSALPLATPLYAKGYVLLLALAGLMAAGWRRDWRAALPAVWAALLVLCITPQVVGLPGSGAIDYLTGLSALYLPLASLAGYALGLAQAGVGSGLARLSQPAPADAPRALRPRASALAGSALVGLALLATVAWGASWQMRMLDGSTQLVSRADVAAMEWVRAATPPGARFMVNAFPAYGGTLVAGTDAGWWIPLLAGRQTTLPPLTYGSERGPKRGYAWSVSQFYGALRGRKLADARPVSVDLTTPEALGLLRAAGVTYVYLGAIASPPPAAADHIDAERLRASPAFRLAYDRDGVQVFELLPAGG